MAEQTVKFNYFLYTEFLLFLLSKLQTYKINKYPF